MRPRAAISLLLLLALALPAAGWQASATGSRLVDHIAVRIEDDVILESEVRELAAFQQLVGGQQEPRNQIVQKLIDQWIVHSEAVAAQSPSPLPASVDEAWDRLAKQFSSAEEFRSRMTALRLSESAVKRTLGQEIYLGRFLDYKFRPAAQVDPKKVQDYYHTVLAKQMEAQGEPLPPIGEVEDQIRELLIQSEISDRSTRWLEDTKQRLHIDIALAPGGAQ